MRTFNLEQFKTLTGNEVGQATGEKARQVKEAAVSAGKKVMDFAPAHRGMVKRMEEESILRDQKTMSMLQLVLEMNGLHCPTDEEITERVNEHRQARGEELIESPSELTQEELKEVMQQATQGFENKQVGEEISPEEVEEVVQDGEQEEDVNPEGRVPQTAPFNVRELKGQMFDRSDKKRDEADKEDPHQ